MAYMDPRPATIDPFLERWLRASMFEIIPTSDMDAVLAHVPRGARVHVTRSAAQAPDKFLDQVRRVVHHRPDVTVVPHIAARCIRNRRHLADIVHALMDVGVRDAFVISGDGTDRAAGYVDGLSVIRDMREIAPDFGRIGIPGYPGGHPFIADGVLAEALRDKAPYADFVCTQMCFSVPTIAAWLGAVRAAGVALPVYISVPGVMSRVRLLRIAVRIGVGQSTRFLRTHGRLAGALLGSSTYRPDAIVAGLRRTPDIDRLGVAGFTLCTFNQVEATEAWRQQQLVSG